MWATLKAKGTPWGPRVVGFPLVIVIWAGAIGSFVWADVAYGYCVSVRAPKALSESAGGFIASHATSPYAAMGPSDLLGFPKAEKAKNRARRRPVIRTPLISCLGSTLILRIEQSGSRGQLPAVQGTRGLTSA